MKIPFEIIKPLQFEFFFFRHSGKSCYDQDDVLVTFDDSDDSEKSREKKDHVKNMADLDSTSGRLVFKNKRILKAENFMHGLADGLGSITLVKSSSGFHGKFDLTLCSYMVGRGHFGMVKHYEPLCK